MPAAIHRHEATDTTEDDARSRRGRTSPRSSALWTLVLESERPAAGSLQVDLADLSELVLGRGPERSVTRNGPHVLLTVPDRFMSTAHVRVRVSDGVAELEDAESKNGTFVNGKRVESAVLADGDVVEIGRSFAIFRAPVPIEPDPAPEPPPSEALHTLHPGLDSQFRRLRRIASSAVPVLLLGETGTGKDVAAGEVHRISARPGAFVPVNCPAIPASLIESELFGYKKGAFSGALEDRPGLVRSADRGTLFLDEIGDLPLPAQAAFLRTLQQSEVLPLGSFRPVKVDVRVIAATHRDVDALVREERFRADLLARLAGFRLRLPPLRERREDLGMLVARLLRRCSADEAAHVQFEPETARALLLHDWPLNVRELEKCLASAVVLAGAGPVAASHLHESVRAALDRKPPAAVRELDEQEARHREELLALLREHRGNIAAVARARGKGRTQIQRWVKRYRIDLRQFRR